MATAADEYWMSYLRDDAAELGRESLQRKTMKQNAEDVIRVTECEREEMRKVLLDCDVSTRTWLAPLIDVPGTHYLLYNAYKEETEKNVTNYIEAVKVFQQRLQSDEQLREKLNEALENIDDAAQKIKATFEAARRCAEAPPPSSKEIKETLEKRKARTWKDIPEKELAQRLSKGEVIPRDDWIPGISKGGRKLKPVEFKAHIEFGERLKKEGNEAFTNQQFSLALTRYSQGVNLLNWVEGEDEESTKKVQDLLLVFLKNQAAAALQLEEYRTAQEAATQALQIDEYDSKSRFRRAQAAIALGDLPAGKTDFMFMLRSPYSTTESHMAARQGLKQLRNIVTKWKTDVKELMTVAASEEMFSSQRDNTLLRNDVVGALSDSTTSTNSDLFKNRHMSHKSTEYAINNTLNNTSTSFNAIEPSLNEEDTAHILTDILDIYTSPETQSLLNTLRREADFEEHRILIRARKYLPPLIGATLDDYIKGGNFSDKKKILDYAVQYWRRKNEKIKALSEGVYKSFLGDTLDD